MVEYVFEDMPDGRTHVSRKHGGWPHREGNFQKCNTLWGAMLFQLKRSSRAANPRLSMWAISVKVNPSGDIVTIPNLPENLLDPAGVPNGISSKVIIDATTPVAPD
ncbi:MAG: hypothetical protein E5Y18_14640, partial [Mesorhizobium sp.]